MTARQLRIRPLTGLPELREGDDLGRLIAEAVAPAADEIVVVSQKAVSKVEGRVRRLTEVEPGDRARAVAAQLDKDPALVELVLSESRRIVRAERGVLITETDAGWDSPNAGIDSSNLEEGLVSLLPEDGDASARRIRQEIGEASGVTPAVVVADKLRPRLEDRSGGCRDRLRRSRRRSPTGAAGATSMGASSRRRTLRSPTSSLPPPTSCATRTPGCPARSSPACRTW